MWCLVRVRMQLDRFTGSAQAMREACKAALAGLHSCLGGSAVHGDVRIPNIFLRWVVCCAQGLWGGSSSRHGLK